jgi:NADH:ubiquinone oxidoreductase subunit 6 (subunit J)
VAAFEFDLLQDCELFLFAVFVFEFYDFDFIGAILIVIAVGSVDVLFVGHGGS